MVHKGNLSEPNIDLFATDQQRANTIGACGNGICRKLIKVILSVILASLFTGHVSFSDQNVRIEARDVQRTDEKWHSVLSPTPIEFKHFEAVIRDTDGKQYAMVASIAGNKYRYEAYAWLANTDKWFEIYRATPKLEWEGADVWTQDRRLVYSSDIGAGWQIKARSDEAAFEVSTKPERPVSHYSISGSAADFGGYISFRAKVDGKIVVDNRDTHVSGLGYCIHTFGDMGDHIAWKYIGFRNEKLCITGMNAEFDTDLMNMLVTVDGDMKINRYEPDRVSWKEVDQNTWQISALHNETDSRRLDVVVRLIKPRSTNKDQPYSKFSLGFVGGAETFLYEYLADIQVTVTGPYGRLELRDLGTASKFELIR